MSGVRISKVSGIRFKDVHPTRSTGKRLVTSGDDVKYCRCKQCGFIVNTDINKRGSGWGNDTYIPITTISGGTANISDPVVSAGCPFCGSSEY